MLISCCVASSRRTEWSTVVGDKPVWDG